MRGVRVVYDRTVALDSIDLDLPAGVVGLFGPNGSGKSTLLRVLAGLHQPDAGDVRLGGSPVALGDENFRRGVGYAGHASGLYERLTLRENLILFASLYGKPAAAADLVLERLDLQERGATPVVALSAGFKRRASVARAMVHDPHVLLLDEPYANLDEDSSGVVTSAIRAWSAADRIAVIATHGAKRVRAYATEGVVLQNGIVTSHRQGFREPSR